MDAQAERRRVIFLGGSSLWFGIDSGLVEQTLGVQSFNLGLHAMYPLGQIVNEVRPAIRPGDVIIMPLEFEYYTIDTAYNPWYLNQVMVGAPEIFWASSWQEKISFMISVPPMRVLEGITTRMFSGPEGRVSKRQIGQSSDQVMTLMRQAWDKGSEPEEVYTFRNIDPRGDAIVSRGSYISYVYPISMDTVAHAYPWQVLASFAQYCARHSVYQNEQMQNVPSSPDSPSAAASRVR